MSGGGEREREREADEIEATLRAIRRLLWRPFAADIAAGGLTAPQVALLAELAAADGPSLGGLSRRLGLSHSTASGIVDRLERRGLVRRRPDPRDGRVTSVALAEPVRASLVRTLPGRRRGPLIAALERATPAGSRQYRDFEDYLLPADTWEEMRGAGTAPVAVEPDFPDYIGRRSELLDGELRTVGRLIAANELPDVRLAGDDLRVAPLRKDVPDGVDELARAAYGLLPRVKLTDLLVEVDGWTGFSRHFTHLRSGEASRDREVLFAVLLADGINLGLTKMAEACPGMTFERLAWVSDWHIR